MTVSDLKDYIKSKASCGVGIEIEGVDLDSEKYIGVYSKVNENRICIGTSSYQELNAVIRLHWTKQNSTASLKANEIYQLLKSIDHEKINNTIMLFSHTQPPVFSGRSKNNVVDYAITTKIYYSERI